MQKMTDLAHENSGDLPISKTSLWLRHAVINDEGLHTLHLPKHTPDDAFGHLQVQFRNLAGSLLATLSNNLGYESMDQMRSYNKQYIGPDGKLSRPHIRVVAYTPRSTSVDNGCGDDAGSWVLHRLKPEFNMKPAGFACRCSSATRLTLCCR